MNLRQFDPKTVFSAHAMREARVVLAEGNFDIEVRKWTRSVGPIWGAEVLGGNRAFLGFQPSATEGGWALVASCDWCSDRRCEHAAALAIYIHETCADVLARWQDHLDNHLLTFGPYSAESLKDLPDYQAAFQAWLSQQERIRVPAVAPLSKAVVEDAGKHIFLLAQTNRSAHGPAELRIGRSRPLKTKKEQMTRIEWVMGEHDQAYRAATRSDPLLRRLVEWAALNFHSNYGFAPGVDTSKYVVDSQGVDLLKDIAAERRLFAFDATDRPIGPLAWASPRSIEWQWREGDAGKVWTVRPAVPGCIFCLGDQPLYIDAGAKKFGEVDLGGLAVGRVIALLSAPPIPKTWLVENAKAPLTTRLLPRPPDDLVRRSDRVVQVVPTPVLTVAVAGKQTVFSIGLAFRYGDLLEFFPPGAEQIQFITKRRQVIELVRDVQSEAAALDIVRAQGLVFSGSGGDLRFSDEKDKQIEGFRRLLATDFAAFREAGFEIETVKGWESKVIETSNVEGGFGVGGADFSSPSSFLEFSLGFFIDGQRYNLLPLIPQLLTLVGGADGIQAMTLAIKDDPELKGFEPMLWVVDEEGRWIGLPRAHMVPWLATLVELVADRKPRDLAAPSLKVSRIEALRLEANSPDTDLGSEAAAVVRELLEAKRATEPLELPGFRGNLEAFQRAGVRWMGVLSRYRLGGMLGDDRGLGKTWQCIGHLVDLKNRSALGAPALIVAPPTQIHHWRHHLQALAPSVSLLTLYGSERSTLMKSASGYEAVLTSWDTVTRYVEQLRSTHFQVAFLDETEKIHNSSTLVSKALRLLDIGYEIALNGSPLENNYGDVWSVVDAVLPGYLGTDASFRRSFRTPIEMHGDEARLKTLRRRIAPFMLRRLKGESGVNLPPVVHQDVPLRIRGAQANLYEMIRLTTAESVREAMKSSGLKGEPTSILPILTKLRQVCCDPSLTSIGREQNVVGSAKLDWLAPKLDEMHMEGRRVLLVGFFVEFFHLIEAMLVAKGIAYSKIIGSMTATKRESEKQAFKAGVTSVFLLGLKSGGRGTDLPEADTVIHLDPWYNPKAHDQATDRAHRIGQKNTVTNLRLFVEGSIEERVIEIQDRKRLFADSLDSEAIFDEHKITNDDILEMLKPLRPEEDAS